MSTKLKYEKYTNGKEAYAFAKSKITDAYIAQFQVKADVKYDDANNKMSAKGKGFELLLDFKEDYVEIDLNLSLMLKAFKGTVMSRIEGELKGNV